MTIKHYILRTAASWIFLLGFMLLTEPQNLPVLLLIVPFVLLFVACSSLWKLVSAIVQHYRLERAAENRARRLRYTVCGGLVVLLVLQSLGQLTVRDVLTIAAIAVIGYLYIGRARPQVHPR
jgi:hypothetical protein